MPSRRRGRSLICRLRVGDPIILRVVERVDHLRDQLVRLGDLQHGSGVLVSTAIISGGEYGEQAATGESFKSVHDAFVRPQNEADLVVLEECLDTIGTELDNVACAVRISDEVGLNAYFRVTVGRIGPENIDHKLLFDGGDFVDNFKRPPDLLDLLKTHEGATNTAVDADDPVFDDGREGKPIEEVVDLVED